MFSVSDTIRESLKLAWKHKILWVFALLIASGGSNFNLPSSDSDSSPSSSNKSKDYNEQNFESNSSSSSSININGNEADFNNATEQDIENMMRDQFGDDLYNQMQNSELIDSSTSSSTTTNYDTTTDDSVNPYIQEIKDFASQITDKNAQVMLNNGEEKIAMLADEFLNKSIGYIVIVAIALLLVIILGVGLTLFMQSWAMGALIGGVDDVLNDKPYTLFSLGTWGRKSVKQLFKYNIYLFILTFLIVFGGIIIPVIMFAIDNTALNIIGGIILFVSVIGIFIFLFLAGFGSPFATRFIVLNGEHYKVAFKNGIETFKKNIGVTLKLAIANCVVGCVFVIIIGGILIGVVGGIAIAVVPAMIAGIAGSSTLTIVFVVLGVIIGLPVFIGLSILMSGFSGFTTTYTMFTNHKLYRFVMGIDKGTSNNNTIDVFNTPQNPNPGTDINMGGDNNAK